jgi:hypothetical protein
LDLQDRVQFVFLLDVLLDLGDRLVRIHVDHLDGLIRWNTSQSESKLRRHSVSFPVLVSYICPRARRGNFRNAP